MFNVLELGVRLVVKCSVELDNKSNYYVTMTCLQPNNERHNSRCLVIRTIKVLSTFYQIYSYSFSSAFFNAPGIDRWHCKTATNMLKHVAYREW